MMIYQSLKHLPYWVSWMIKATVSHKFKKVWVYQTIILPDNNYNVDSIMNYSLTSFLSLFVRQWILDIFGVHNGKDGLQEFISRYPSQKLLAETFFFSIFPFIDGYCTYCHCYPLPPNLFYKICDLILTSRSHYYHLGK